MTQRVSEYDIMGTLAEAGIIPANATDAQIALADRFLIIHQGDPKKAGKALGLHLKVREGK